MNMSEEHAQDPISNTPPTVEPDSPSKKATERKASDDRKFSWYGGQVDETVIREIVRLKREQKL
jgi:hypothetical protein